jgi:hypothetical protein
MPKLTPHQTKILRLLAEPGNRAYKASLSWFDNNLVTLDYVAMITLQYLEYIEPIWGAMAIITKAGRDYLEGLE